MKRILLLGSEGQVGRELQATLSPVGELIGINHQKMDLTQGEAIRQIIGEVKPNIIVNAAAYTAVDKAESEPEIAYAANAIAPTIMAEEAKKLGAFLVHFSTDYVFDGRKNTPYNEEDSPNPLSVYGKSKLAGEEGIQQIGGRYAILRTAWVYGAYGKSNFVKTMLRLGREREEIRVVCDQIGSPTWAKDIAEAIAQLILQSEEKDISDIYHFTDSGVASWYDFAIAIFEKARELGFSGKVQRIVPITTAEYPTPAKRPAYSVLSTRKIAAVLDNYPPYWRDPLWQMLRHLQEVELLGDS